MIITPKTIIEAIPRTRVPYLLEKYFGFSHNFSMGLIEAIKVGTVQGMTKPFSGDFGCDNSGYPGYRAGVTENSPELYVNGTCLRIDIVNGDSMLLVQMFPSSSKFYTLFTNKEINGGGITMEW